MIWLCLLHRYCHLLTSSVHDCFHFFVSWSSYMVEKCSKWQQPAEGQFCCMIIELSQWLVYLQCISWAKCIVLFGENLFFLVTSSSFTHRLHVYKLIGQMWIHFHKNLFIKVHQVYMLQQMKPMERVELFTPRNSNQAGMDSFTQWTYFLKRDSVVPCSVTFLNAVHVCLPSWMYVYSLFYECDRHRLVCVVHLSSVTAA